MCNRHVWLRLALLVAFAPGCSNPTVSNSRVSAITADATDVTGGGDNLRTGWYPDQAALSPQTVGGATFGRLFSAAVTGQVYAQPLVWADTLFIATESNDIYGLDPESGSVRWTRNVGVPFNASDVRCGDLTPTIGVTGTPVIDRATHTAYFFSKTYVSGAVAWFAHAVDIVTGVERPSFPVAIAGSAANDPTKIFVPKVQMQRPGLLLMDGVVYAAFGAHCDHYTRPAELYRGWIAAVSTSGQLKTLFTTSAGDNGFASGIWQSGSGLVSDGPGKILFSTGNAIDQQLVKPLPGNAPPGNLTEAVVRVEVGADGALTATDFFQPYDADKLDEVDADLGSGGPVALPSEYFGTATFPRLLVEVGKQGYVYLLNRDHLGGIAQGSGGGDLVVGRVGPIGQGKNRGVWGRPAVWPGDGGHLYMIPSDLNMLDFKYGLGGDGRPSLTQVATSNESYGYTSGSPVVTSDGTTSGSALVWVIGAGGGNGANGVLRAYDALPVNGRLPVRFEQAIGTSAKFSVPGVGKGRIYVGTRDGHVIGFGAPIAVPISGPNTSFGTVTVGKSQAKTIVLTANRDVVVNGIDSSSSEFVVGAISRSLPASLATAETITVDVTFTPATVGSHAANLAIATSQGTAQLALTGTGQSAAAVLTASSNAISFGGTAIGTTLSANLLLANVGAAPLTIRSLTLPQAPFSAGGLPMVGATIAAGDTVTVGVTFAPTAIGSFVDHLIIDSTGGAVDVQLSGSAAPPGKLTIEPLTLDFGKVAVGDAKSASFKISNSGGSAITINKSKPPALGPFIANTALDEGTLIAAGASLVQTVVFKPSAIGAVSDGWVLTASDGSGQQTVAFGGEGVPGGGLKGDFYAGAELAQFQLSRTDSTVDFDWSATTPDPLLAPGQPYSVRWSGQLTPKFSEIYTLSFVSQGGARVWVDGAIVIDQWTDHDLQEDAADVSLTAGRASTILIEYFNSGSGGARASLRWASPSQPAEVVPTDALRFGAPDPIAGGWTLNGSASLVGATLQLTPATSGAHGSAFWPRPLPSSSIRASFDLAIDSGSGADGLTLAFADALHATPNALGNGGGGLAFSGIAGIAIAFDTHHNAGDPSHNFVGISDGPGAHADQLHWLSTATDIPPLRGVTRHVEINARDGRLAVAIDGKAALELAVQLPPQVLVGFTAANGGLNDRHAVANVLIR